jgi:hypothetical protein
MKRTQTSNELQSVQSLIDQTASLSTALANKVRNMPTLQTNDNIASLKNHVKFLERINAFDNQFYDNRLKEQAENLEKDKALMQREHNVAISHLNARRLREMQELRLHNENLQERVKELKERYQGEARRWEEQNGETKKKQEREWAEWQEQTAKLLKTQKSLMGFFKKKVTKLKKRVGLLEKGNGGSPVSSSSSGGNNGEGSSGGMAIEEDPEEEYIFNWMEMPV